MLACAAAPATAFTGPRGAPPRGMRALRMTATSEPPPPTVVLTRARGDNTGLRKLLDDKMIATVELPCVEHYELTGDGGGASAADECTQGSCPDAVGLDALVDELNGSRAASRWAWVVLPSPTAAVTFVNAWSLAGKPSVVPRIAALGASGAAALDARSDGALSAEFVPSIATAAALGEELPLRAADEALAPRSKVADDGISPKDPGLEAKEWLDAGGLARARGDGDEAASDAAIGRPKVVIVTSQQGAGGDVALRLEARGFDTTCIACYASARAPAWDSAAKELVARQNAEGAGVSPLIVTFASPGAVAAWQQLSREAVGLTDAATAGDDAASEKTAPRVAACLGSKAAAAAREAGVRDVFYPLTPSLAGWADATSDALAFTVLGISNPRQANAITDRPALGKVWPIAHLSAETDSE